MTPAQLAERLGAKRSGNGWMARCPAHEDQSPSLSISEGDDGKVLVNCFAGCATTGIMSKLGLAMADLMPPKVNGHDESISYRYTDETGTLLSEVMRGPGKTFSQRPANGRRGPGAMQGTRLVLYGLPRVIKAVANGATVYICEGEKDADRVVAEGHCATTNPMGAGKWNKVRDHARQILGGANVVVVQDNDGPGRRHAAEVVADLRGFADSVVLVKPLDGCKDVSDHLAAGHSLAELDEVVEEHDHDGEEHQHRDDEDALADGFRPTDVGNAMRLVRSTAGNIRFVHKWQKWIVYFEGRWIIDDGDALVTEAAKQVARELFRSAVDLPRDERERVYRHARRCEQANSISNMLRMARGIPGVLVDHGQLDADPWLLNVLNGTVDLHTNQLRPHNPDDLLTMQAPVMFDAEATSPLFDQCVQRWQPDEATRRLLQQAVGSGITGHPLERLFINIGNGANGKTKFYGAMADTIGPFAVTPHKSLLVASKHEGHPTHVASLFRARMLIAPETSQDDRLDEEMVKNLTGGDMLAARRMREDEWRFAPSHTAFMHTNHRPKITGTDEGIWRRLVLIPWAVTIPADERDERLADKLKAERSGILNWMIAGAVDWLNNGLTIPHTVSAATEAYRNSEDQIGRFIADCCIIGDTESVTARSLRTAYEAWCADSNEIPFSAQALGQSMNSRGFDSARVGHDRARTWIGIGTR